MNDKMSVEIPSDRENDQKENLTINEDPPSYSNEDSNQDIHGPASSDLTGTSNLSTPERASYSRT